MPELPEVEYATQRLRGWLSGKKIRSAHVPPSLVVRGPVEKLLAGRKVTAVDRRGKWIRIALSGGKLVYSHLGMTGKWVRRAASDAPERFERARLDVSGASVRYLDPRMFGRLIAADHVPAWDALGPDPLIDGVDVRALTERFSRTRRSVKETLMDQTVLAGVGNIQASESLWRAKIHPGRSAQSVAKDPKKMRALARAIQASIAFTLAQQGHEDEIAYVEEPGSDNPFKVYGRAGERCPRGDGKIRRVVQGGRSTFYCAACQAFVIDHEAPILDHQDAGARELFGGRGVADAELQPHRARFGRQ
jgi:formamidopyrimidine-DNA glycosylase